MADVADAANGRRTKMQAAHSCLNMLEAARASRLKHKFGVLLYEHARLG